MGRHFERDPRPNLPQTTRLYSRQRRPWQEATPLKERATKGTVSKGATRNHDATYIATGRFSYVISVSVVDVIGRETKTDFGSGGPRVDGDSSEQSNRRIRFGGANVDVVVKEG
jgi:hypothetical protein